MLLTEPYQLIAVALPQVQSQRRPMAKYTAAMGMWRLQGTNRFASRNHNEMLAVATGDMVRGDSDRVSRAVNLTGKPATEDWPQQARHGAEYAAKDSGG